MEKLLEEIKTPTRSEISESDTWDLSHLYRDTAGWQTDFDWLQQNYTRISEWNGKLNESADSLASCLEFEKELDLKLERLYHFASLQLAEDSANNRVPEPSLTAPEFADKHRRSIRLRHSRDSGHR